MDSNTGTPGGWRRSHLCGFRYLAAVTGTWQSTCRASGAAAARPYRKIPAESLRPLPPIREARPELAEIAHALAQETGPDDREFDVFISHASEDKEAVVRPLAQALSSRGLAVWYDEFELRIGDSLRQKIDAGIARSGFGIVVLSAPFFSKSWPKYELDGLVTMAVSGRQVLLPLWHGVSKDEVINQSPSLADKVALRTADSTIDEIADEIAAVVRGE